ncbi:MAG: hypothetical protein K1X92_18740 [Bacteroidia bacterium]|nr:hypothetical protein [Bacteroidia bacterium]
MIFLTFGEAPSGVLVSQGFDVVKLLREELKANIRLVCFVSLRGFGNTRKYIRQYQPDAIVLPMFPKLKNWKWNYLTLFFLSFFVDTKIIIARNIWASQLALRLKKTGRAQKVCYDGRGAYMAEVQEYGVIPDESVKAQVPSVEKSGVLDADYHIAVTTELVKYWEKNFGYTGNNHVVIPCTLSNDFAKIDRESIIRDRNEIRESLGWSPGDVVLVFSGSTAGWQSLGLLHKILQVHLKKNPSLRILFLSKESKEIQALTDTYPSQVVRKWLSHNEVGKHLNACDYGILIREQSVTNQVAAPTKFAEYLMCGLKVLISEKMGDYSDFTLEHNCGTVVNEENIEQLSLQPVGVEEKLSIARTGITHFSKQSEITLNRYRQLLKALSS